jgi:hypothetical protein
METIKNKIQSDFLREMEEMLPQMPEHALRAMASRLSNMAWEAVRENTEGFSREYVTAISEMEAHKKMFRDHIDDLQATTKSLLTEMRKHGFATTKTDPRTGKTVLVGRTTVLTGIIDFLNRLSDMVSEFYTRVYRIEPERGEGRSQIKLF